jgi:hypothetical protein
MHEPFVKGELKLKSCLDQKYKHDMEITATIWLGDNLIY